MARALGVDYGTKRVGIAISDALGLMARPLEVVSRGEALDRIGAIVSEEGVATIVVGLPARLAGGEGSSAAAARSFGEEIAGRTGARVVYADERFTTRLAEAALLESGMSRRRRRSTVDKVAAAIILQDYLDAEARRREHGAEPGHPSP